MKLINTPKECGLRHKVITRLGLDSGIRVCKHSSMVAGSCFCNKDNEFPLDCPLEDGLLKKQIHWP